MPDFERYTEIFVKRIDRLENTVEKQSDKSDDNRDEIKAEIGKLREDIAAYKLAQLKRCSIMEGKFKDLKWKYYFLAFAIGGGGGTAASKILSLF
ncbi:MAG: hypothetical protein GY861_00995 [bacterium]|nr:hypothetical protein [bacterium]